MPDPRAPETRPATFQDIIAAEAKKQGVDPRVALAIAGTESSFNPAAKSPKGALGIMQLMPETATRLGVDPTDPIQNIRGGLTEFRRLLDEHKGDVVMALRRYNGSPQAPEAATEPYVQSVLGRLQGRPGARPSLGRLRVGQSPDAAQADTEPVVPPIPSMIGKPPAIPPPPDVPDLNLGQKAVELGGTMLSAVDPRTREGRRNIAGGVGAGLATAGLVATAPVSAPVAGLTALGAGVLGAVGGGMTAEAGEQIVGTAPPSEMAVAGAGSQQGAYEVAGQALVWPVKAIGRRLIASRVGRAAHEGLQQARASTMAHLDNALSAASQAAGDVKALAAQTVRYARRQAGESLRAARTAGKGTIETAEQQGAASVAGATTPYTSLVGQAPSTARAGRAAAATIEGPATQARDIVGKQVEAAAKDGPDVDISELKAEAQRILERLQPPATTFPRRVAEAEVPEALSAAGTPVGKAAELHLQQKTMQALEKKAATGDARAADDLLVLQEQVNAAQKAAQEQTLQHPAMGVISRILNAGDVVPFFDAHLWKSELQNALQGTYDKAVKKQVTSITQRLTGSLREALAIHEPYNEATAAYAKIVPLYTKEYAARLKKNALSDPESLIRMINPNKPTAARMLRDVLVTQSAEGGDAAGGQRAWDLVRSAWTHTHVLKGGVEKLDANLAKLPEEFSTVFYGDQSGQAVLQNLRQIASAYKVAAAGSEAGIGVAKTVAERGLEQARRVGEAGIEQATREGAGTRRLAAGDITAARRAKRVAKAPTAEEVRFGHSTVAGKQPTLDELVAHGLRAFVLGPTQIWGGLSWLKLMRGPAEKDLLEWAAYSSANTQRLVGLLTGPSPTGMAIADVLRSSGILSAPEPTKPAARVGQPPPR